MHPASAPRLPRPDSLSPRSSLGPRTLAGMALTTLLSATLALGSASALAVQTSAMPPAVSGFDIARYVGEWHEAARIGPAWYSGLQRTSVMYTRSPDGSIRVIHRGFDPQRQAWQEAQGTARFTGDPKRGALHMTFAGPYQGNYNVVALDSNYQWAMVMGSHHDTLRVLSRTPTLPQHVRDHLMERANALGMDASKIQWLPHTDAPLVERKPLLI